MATCKRYLHTPLEICKNYARHNLHVQLQLLLHLQEGLHDELSQSSYMEPGSALLLRNPLALRVLNIYFAGQRGGCSQSAVLGLRP